MTMIYGLQGWASTRAPFGEDTSNELASFTNHVVVFGGAKDPAFLREMSDICGRGKRVRTTHHHQRRPRSESTATHVALEPVLRSDKIKGLDEGHVLVLADNLPGVATRLDGIHLGRVGDDPEARTRTASSKRSRARSAASRCTTPLPSARE